MNPVQILVRLCLDEDWKYNIDDVGSKWVFVEEEPYWNKVEDGLIIQMKW